MNMVSDFIGSGKLYLFLKEASNTYAVQQEQNTALICICILVML